MCTAVWLRRKKNPKILPRSCPRRLHPCSRHLRKTYVPACDNISSVVRLAKAIGEVSCRVSSRVLLLQVPLLPTTRSYLTLHLCMLRCSAHITRTPLSRTKPHLRNRPPQWCVDHQHVPDGPPPVTSPKSERSARAWGSPISSSSLFTARQPRIAGRKPHNIESLRDRKKKVTRNFPRRPVRWLSFCLSPPTETL
jgi:hypothetical protein